MIELKTDPKKKLMFDRALKIIRLLKKEGKTKGSVIAYELGISTGLAHLNCTRLVNAGIIGSKTHAHGGYFLTKDSIKMGQLFAAMDMPMLETGVPKVDKAFKDYLNMEILDV